MAYRQDFSSIRCTLGREQGDEQDIKWEAEIPSQDEMNLPPTQRQLDMCDMIGKVTGNNFDGSTRQQACEFIDEWLDEYELMIKTGRKE